MIIREPSEFGNKRNVPRTIIVHAMGEYLLDPKPIHATDFLVKLGLSAHALIAPNGDVYICRDDDQGAYHARGYNTDSLGVEFLVEGNHDYGSFLSAIKEDYVTLEQWDAGVQVVKSWLSVYNIKQLSRHSDVSPGRKVDPGTGFKWDDFLSSVEWDNE